MFFEKKHISERKAPAPVSRFARVFFDGRTIPGAPLSMASFRFEPGQYGPKHVHEKEVEVYYGLRGEGLVVIDDTEYTLRPDTLLYIRPGAYHETKNTGEEDFEFLAVFAPCLDLQSFEEWEFVTP